MNIFIINKKFANCDYCTVYVSSSFEQIENYLKYVSFFNCKYIVEKWTLHGHGEYLFKDAWFVENPEYMSFSEQFEYLKIKE